MSGLPFLTALLLAAALEGTAQPPTSVQPPRPSSAPS